MVKPSIFPSLISADIMNLRGEIEKLDPHCDGYHIDVMDNQFVPNLTWGSQFVNAIANTTQKPLFVHLMVKDPTNWIDELNLTQHSSIVIHIESEGIARKNLMRIKERYLNAGIALNPQSSVETIFHVLDLVDSVLLMSVEPGLSGQTFLPEVLKKIDPILGYRQAQGLKFHLAMDGGIGQNNIARLALLGVEQFGIASAIFDEPNQLKALKELYALIRKTI